MIKTMPIEIRELIIKTEISTTTKNDHAAIADKDLEVLKRQLLEECKRIIAAKTNKNNYKR
ncbi:hypothetical protein AQF98_05290 [Pedobacter sp. Hv1]|nr:hypothetical protein AQF98_05290 [Pedobacter sp. Hv1]